MAEKKVRYEYMSETPFVGDGGNSMGILLTSRAKEGWEFMFAVKTSGKAYFIYKREIDE